MSDACELCRRAQLEPVYVPAGTQRGLKVQLCKSCGLIQSTPRIDRAPRNPAAASTGADWGNIRYGKSFRTQACLAALARRRDLSKPVSLLDVGSNRASFAKAFLAAAPQASLTAVEPDERVAPSAAGLERTELIEARIEDTALESERFDIVHSCHTIEHLAHPAAVLADHWRVLRPGGLLILDAPSTAFLDTPDVVEEWFIDKHLYHFSARTLMRMVTAAGFAVIEPPDLSDRENLLIVASRSGRRDIPLAADPREVDEAGRLIAAYGSNRAANLAALTAMATQIAALKDRRVVLWGAGRLFDALVTQGGFMPAMLAGLIDAHLGQHLPIRHGCSVKAPDALAAINPDVVVVMSRGFAGEIVREAQRLAPRAEILTYTDLMTRARFAA